MKKLQLTRIVLNCFLVAVIALNIIAYFMPYYRSTYISTYYNEKTVTDVLLYSGYIAISPFVSLTLIIPIMAIAFLFMNFKNSKPISFAFTASQFMTNILLILSIKSYMEDRSSENYTYQTLYGYDMCIATTVLLAIALTAVIAIYIVIQFKTKAQTSQQPDNKTKSEIDIFRERIGVLDDLKQSGVLTDSEYEQKRNEIVKELKV